MIVCTTRSPVGVTHSYKRAHDSYDTHRQTKGQGVARQGIACGMHRSDDAPCSNAPSRGCRRTDRPPVGMEANRGAPFPSGWSLAGAGRAYANDCHHQNELSCFHLAVPSLCARS